MEFSQETCSCKKTKCVRHGNCEACIAFHKNSKRAPYCIRSQGRIGKIFKVMTLLVLAVVLLAGAGIFGTIRIMENKYADVTTLEINEVDLLRVRDGIYSGEYAYGKFSYEVEVTIVNNEILDIKIIKNRDSKHAILAEGVISRVISEQTPNVDVISGATRTSKAILKAIEHALVP